MSKEVGGAKCVQCPEVQFQAGAVKRTAALASCLLPRRRAADSIFARLSAIIRALRPEDGQKQKVRRRAKCRLGVG